MTTAKKLNNLHILALYLDLHGPAIAAHARGALIEQRFGKLTENNRDSYGQYFHRQGHFTAGCKYAVPGRHQLWSPCDPHDRYHA